MKRNGRWLWDLTRGNRLRIFLLSLVESLQGFGGVYTALLLKELLDAAQYGNTAGFWRAAITVVILRLALIGATYGTRLLYTATHTRVDNALRRRVFELLLEKEYAAVTATHSGEWMNRLTTDTAAVSSYLVNTIPSLVQILVTLVSAAAALFSLMPDVTGILLGLCLLGGGVLLKLQPLTKELHRRIREADGDARVFFQENLQNTAVVRSFHVQEEALAQADRRLSLFGRTRMRFARFAGALRLGYSLAAGLVTLGVTLYCAWGILQGDLTYGTLTAMLTLLSRFGSPFSSLIGSISQIFTVQVSVDRIREIEGWQAAEEETPLPLSEAVAFYERELTGFGIRNGSFTYPDGETSVFRDLTVTFKKGHITALTGESGRGKSTVMKALLGLYPLKEGECFVATAAGEAPLTSRWRRLFAYVPQGNGLMSGTIRQVLAFGDEVRAKEDGALWQALKTACAAEFVEQLPGGLDAPLQELGAGLSEGQTQRLAIARALFSGHPILLLDESTSALDPETEARLLQNLRQDPGRTVLIITHRQAVLAYCDEHIHFEEE